MRLSIVAAVLILAPFSASGQSARLPAELFRDIEKRYSNEYMPQPLWPPITTEQADAFVAAIQFMRESARTDLPLVEAVNPREDRQLQSDKQRLTRWLAEDLARKLDEVLQQTREALQGEVASKADFVKFAADIDLQDKHKVVNNFGNPDNVRLREDAVREGLATIDLLIRIDAQLGTSSDWPARRKEFAALADRFHEKLNAAAATIVPPKDIGDAQLREIAETTLKDPRYSVPEIKRLIVNTPKQQRQFSTYGVHDNWVLRSDYDYEFFQATTIEPEGAELFLFHNTLANYKSGSPSTPLNKWVIRERFRGARIMPENVDK